MGFRAKALWVICVSSFWLLLAWSIWGPHRASQVAAKESGADTNNLYETFERLRQESDDKGRYQLIAQPEGLLLFDTSTARMWAMTSRTNWVRISTPLDLKSK